MSSVGSKIAGFFATPKFSCTRPKSSDLPCQMKVTMPKIGIIKSSAYNVKCTARASLALATLESAAGGGGG